MTPVISRRNLLGLSSAIEIVTGLVLILTPGVFRRLLLGVEVTGDATMLARFFGIALFCLGIAFRPEGDATAGRPASFRALLLYNARIALSSQVSASARSAESCCGRQSPCIS